MQVLRLALACARASLRMTKFGELAGCSSVGGQECPPYTFVLSRRFSLFSGGALTRWDGFQECGRPVFYCGRSRRELARCSDLRERASLGTVGPWARCRRAIGLRRELPTSDRVFPREEMRRRCLLRKRGSWCARSRFSAHGYFQARDIAGGVRRRRE